MTTPLSGYGHHFGIGNIPFGVASHAENTRPTCVTRYGDSVIFLSKLADLSTHKDLKAALDQSSLNNFAAFAKPSQLTVRKHIQDAIRRDETLSALPKDAVKHISEVTMHLPVEVGDFTDFSCSHHHVQNAAEAMTGKRSTPPAFFNMPIGYAGRCSSIDVSGTPVYRPLGQHWKEKPMDSEIVFGPCEKMDYELELGCIIGRPLLRNARVLAEDAEEHIFGYVLINDWSARDIQALEMIPLGPLNGKNAGTTMSPWIITTDALESFKTAPPKRVQQQVSYLKQSGNKAINTQLQVDIASPNNGRTPQTMCVSNSSCMYWNLSQCVAHQAIGGCGLRTGDLLSTGTVSGEGDSEHGCLLEFMKASSTPPRGYLQDGETVTFSGYCGEGVGFGECVATLLPAKEL
ncbi:hypothetical protein M409DRAFT_64274 [Zasmidium cellare ATCC 36951]|uniref:Fumarylacetoacetase n=1 Tax=Zasmidium cellare ATCC 36951 TaxID=1080233 RepID=A0A6A6CXK3_ZASCE|nr:uncharacterized protein M409DRAFT_64274 [Zasmidium cellare ATCC 36951]KAF2170592.1 hypothetical protein M409DRAFT_64274 [Zasmidium cellare ATCC 36951]